MTAGGCLRYSAAINDMFTGIRGTGLMIFCKPPYICAVVRPLRIVLVLFGLFCLPDAKELRASGAESCCAGVYHCLAEKPSFCDNASCRKQPGIDYDTEFCSVFRELRRQGLRPESYWGRRIYTYLSSRHRITYRVTGSIPVSGPMMRYLMNNLPFAAHLVNAYQGTRYSAVCLNPSGSRFRGSNGKNVNGVLTRVLQDGQQQNTVYFGSGGIDFLMWRLRGTGLVVLNYECPDPRTISYRLRCMVFPANPLVRSVMSFVLFRRAVRSTLKTMVDHVQAAATAFYNGEMEPIHTYPPLQTSEAQQHIQKFRRIIRESSAAAPSP